MATSNRSSDPLDPTGRSILSQVAFKGAIDLAARGVIDRGDVITWAKAFTEEMVDFVQVQKDEFFEAKAARRAEHQANADAVSAAEEDFVYGNEDDDDSDSGIKVLGEQHGPLPQWFIKQAKAAGVTKVFDNRESAKGTNRPHFKTPKDADKYGEPADKPFWPPKNK